MQLNRYRGKTAERRKIAMIEIPRQAVGACHVIAVLKADDRRFRQPNLIWLARIARLFTEAKRWVLRQYFHNLPGSPKRQTVDQRRFQTLSCFRKRMPYKSPQPIKSTEPNKGW